MPEDILENVSHQIPGVRPVPKSIKDYSDQEKEEFPKLFDYKENFIVDYKGLDNQVNIIFLGIYPVSFYLTRYVYISNCIYLHYFLESIYIIIYLFI